MAFPEPSLQQPTPHYFYNRIGPIFDPAYLRHLDPGIMKQITLITARAEMAAAQKHVEALQHVIDIVEKAGPKG